MHREFEGHEFSDECVRSCENNGVYIHMGLWQGDHFPLLFNLALERAMRMVSPQGRQGFATNDTKIILGPIHHIDVVAHNTRDVRDIFSLFEFHALTMGLRIDGAKTK